MEFLLDVLHGSWRVLGEMSPFLLLGFLVAGILSVFVDPAWLERNLGGRGLSPVFKASLFGVPLPLCSCGVIPVAASLRAHGAGRPATVAFLLSTPQTGADSILVTWSLLGPLFAVFRPIAALITGVLGGILVRLADSAEFGNRQSVDSCDGDGCCEAHDPAVGGRILRSLRYGLLTLPRDIGTALVVGVLIAGLLGVFFEPDQLHAWIGGGFLSILLMMLAGVPLYVCATASVPIAAALMQAGATPGAALAFLIAGPATNAAALTTVWRFLGPRSAGLYLLTVALSAVSCGLLLNWIAPLAASLRPEFVITEHVHMEGGIVQNLWAGLLLLVLLASKLMPVAAASKPTDDGAETMSRLSLKIGDMNCSQCRDSVTRALRECVGVKQVEVDLKEGLARVEGDRPDPAAAVAAVTALGFSASVLPEQQVRKAHTDPE